MIATLYGPLRPFAVDKAPHVAGGVGILQFDRQAVKTDVVIAVQGGETQHRGRYPYSGKARMAGGRKRSTMVHGRDDRHTGWHLVVQQTAHLLSQDRFEPIVGVVILTLRVGVDAGRQIAFQAAGNRQHLLKAARQHQQGHRAKDLCLQCRRVE